MSDKKKKIIIGAAIIIAIILIIAIIIFSRGTNESETETLENVELSELLEVEDIENLGYKTERTEEEISSKYITGRDKYEVKVNVQAGETEGKMIYARGVENINIYKVEYKLNKYEDKNIEVSNIIQEFEMVCEGYMGLLDEYEQTEQLYGESSAQFELPLEESIYNEGRLYSKTYKDEEKEYDINFYRSNESIICEFVRVF